MRVLFPVTLLAAIALLTLPSMAQTIPPTDPGRMSPLAQRDSGRSSPLAQQDPGKDSRSAKSPSVTTPAAADEAKPKRNKSRK
jgi:hypothetical protein